jgi:hypothetical protein
MYYMASLENPFKASNFKEIAHKILYKNPLPFTVAYS